MNEKTLTIPTPTNNNILWRGSFTTTTNKKTSQETTTTDWNHTNTTTTTTANNNNHRKNNKSFFVQIANKDNYYYRATNNNDDDDNNNNNNNNSLQSFIEQIVQLINDAYNIGEEGIFVDTIDQPFYRTSTKDIKEIIGMNTNNTNTNTNTINKNDAESSTSITPPPPSAVLLLLYEVEEGDQQQEQKPLQYNQNGNNDDSSSNSSPDHHHDNNINNTSSNKNVLVGCVKVEKVQMDNPNDPFYGYSEQNDVDVDNSNNNNNNSVYEIGCLTIDVNRQGEGLGNLLFTIAELYIIQQQIRIQNNCNNNNHYIQVRLLKPKDYIHPHKERLHLWYTNKYNYQYYKSTTTLPANLQLLQNKNWTLQIDADLTTYRKKVLFQQKTNKQQQCCA